MTRARRALAVAAILLAGATLAAADWLQPDPSYREAQMMLRVAMQDTTRHPNDPLALDSLGMALLRLDRQDDAARAFRAVLEQRPGDDAAEAGLGKLALFGGRLAEAESLLTDTNAEGARADLFALKLRAGRWAEAAAMAAEVNEEGRLPLLERLATEAPYGFTTPTREVVVPWTRAYPVPLVRVKLSGQSVLMALDTGTDALLIDDSAARRIGLTPLTGQRSEMWCGGRMAVRNAIVPRLQIGGLVIERVPAGVLSLRKWSLEVNPQSERVAGVIGLGVLSRFTPTLDYVKGRLELRGRGAPLPEAPGATRIPFQIWGASELTVHGTLSGSRRMALVVQTGVPGCGVGAPREVFDEIGIKSGAMAKLVGGTGRWLQGRPWHAVTVPAVTVGPLARDKVAGWSGALDSSELWRHGVRRDGLLSHDFFRGTRMTIDWDARALVIEE